MCVSDFGGRLALDTDRIVYELSPAELSGK